MQLLLFTLLVSCEDVADSSCSGVICDTPIFMIGLEYLDAESGEKLLFGESASYSIDDLSVESLESEIEYSVTVDSTFTDKKSPDFWFSIRCY